MLIDSSIELFEMGCHGDGAEKGLMDQDLAWSEQI
jgi:hypothetical protein